MYEKHNSIGRTRIVCVSDTHGYTPQDGVFKLPKGDILIHAGDLSNQGSMTELRRSVEWIQNADFEVKIVVAGLLPYTMIKVFGFKAYNLLIDLGEEIMISPSIAISTGGTVHPSIIRSRNPRKSVLSFSLIHQLFI
jgi:predicted phosphodiesterase